MPSRGLYVLHSLKKFGRWDIVRKDYWLAGNCSRRVRSRLIACAHTDSMVDGAGSLRRIDLWCVWCWRRWKVLQRRRQRKECKQGQHRQDEQGRRQETNSRSACTTEVSCAPSSSPADHTTRRVRFRVDVMQSGRSRGRASTRWARWVSGSARSVGARQPLLHPAQAYEILRNETKTRRSMTFLLLVGGTYIG